MNLYLLTCHESYSRAIVAAESPEQAQQMRPDGAYWRDGEWMETRLTTIPVAAHARVQVVPATPLDHWAQEPGGVRAMLLGTAQDNISSTVWCYEPHEGEPRSWMHTSALHHQTPGTPHWSSTGSWAKRRCSGPGSTCTGTNSGCCARQSTSMDWCCEIACAGYSSACP